MTGLARRYYSLSTAPSGVHKLNISNAFPISLFSKPLLSSTLQSPKLAGALWIMMAAKMIHRNPGLLDAIEAPIAIPSATAWMRSPKMEANAVRKPDTCG